MRKLLVISAVVAAFAAVPVANAGAPDTPGCFGHAVSHDTHAMGPGGRGEAISGMAHQFGGIGEIVADYKATHCGQETR